MADSYKNACLEYVKHSKDEITDTYTFKQKLPNVVVTKTPYSKVLSDVESGASSPSRLPTPSATLQNKSESTSHKYDLSIDTQFNMDDEYMDEANKDIDIDCGNLSYMASRHVAKEISLIRDQKEKQNVLNGSQ